MSLVSLGLYRGCWGKKDSEFSSVLRPNPKAQNSPTAL